MLSCRPPTESTFLQQFCDNVESDGNKHRHNAYVWGAAPTKASSPWTADAGARPRLNWGELRNTKQCQRASHMRKQIALSSSLKCGTRCSLNMRLSTWTNLFTNLAPLPVRSTCMPVRVSPPVDAPPLLLFALSAGSITGNATISRQSTLVSLLAWPPLPPRANGTR